NAGTLRSPTGDRTKAPRNLELAKIRPHPILDHTRRDRAARRRSYAPTEPDSPRRARDLACRRTTDLRGPPCTSSGAAQPAIALETPLTIGSAERSRSRTLGSEERWR